jgi:hypothetical protein
LVACSALLLVGCASAGDGAIGSGAVARADLGPVFPDADALLEALEDAGTACQPGTLDDQRKWDEHTGSCDLAAGASIYWQLDIGAATKPPQTPSPGDLGSGEERPSVHEEVCEHFGSQLVLGPNWMILGPEADLAPVADGLGAYLFVADCGGKVEAICDRDDFSGTRVVVTVSPDDLSIEPTEVPPGPAVVCIGSSQRGRVYLSDFTAKPSADLSSVQATGTATRNSLSAIPGVAEQSGMAATLTPGSWSEQAEELQPGYKIFLATLLPRDTVPELPPTQVVPAVILIVTQD